MLRNRTLCWRLRMLQRHCRLLTRLRPLRSRYFLLVHDVHPHVRTRGWYAHLLLRISHGCTLRAVLVSSCIRLLLLRTAHLSRRLPVDGSFCSTLIVVHLTRLHCVRCSCLIGHVPVCAAICVSLFSRVSMISLASSIVTEETAKAATPWPLSAPVSTQEDRDEATHTLRCCVS